MELEFKSDFDRTRESWRRFWEGSLGRPILLAVVPREGTEAVPAPKWGESLWRRHEDVVDQALRWAESHHFACDSVPFFTPSLIVGLFSAFLGAEVIQSKEPWGIDTAIVPFVEDLASAEIKLRLDSPWRRKWADLCECVKRKCAGRMVFGEATPGYNLDVLGEIRGAERLMMDFYDNPDGIHRALGMIFEAHKQLVDECRRVFQFDKHGGATRHGFYCDGAIGVPQCDFGFNIGKEHFDEFALPWLKREIELLDAVEYHLDGPGNIAHAESICSIEKIGVVQWVPGAGNESKDWTSLYDKIDSLGKGLWLWAGSPEQARRLWDRYHGAGRMILSVKADSLQEAERYMEAFEP